MAKSASDIVERALTLIDEVVTDFNTAATTETSVRDLALEILPEVCRDLIKELPWDLKRHLATRGTLARETLSDGEDQTSYFKQKVAFLAPDDFLELVSIRLSVWAKPVTDYIYIGSEHYPKQNNPFTRSGKHNPAVALSNKGSNTGARIECFSINDGDSVVVGNFEYVSFDNVPDDDGNNWPNELLDDAAKALSLELNLIKSRLEDAGVKGEEITNNLEQHE